MQAVHIHEKLLARLNVVNLRIYLAIQAKLTIVINSDASSSRRLDNVAVAGTFGYIVIHTTGPSRPCGFTLHNGQK